MEENAKTIINVNGDYVVTKHVENEIGNVENGGIGIQIINGNPSPQSSATKHAQHAEEVEEIVEDKPTPSFFRTNAQSITKIEQKWQEALGNTTKTGVIRFVKSHDSSTGYFKLAGYTNEQLAEEFNKAQTKYKFTENDFENANKPLKK